MVFADVDPDTGLMTPQTLEAAYARVGGRPLKAVLPVHLAGQAADLPAIRAFAESRGAAVVEDACHAVGTTANKGTERIGDCAHSAMACFSFHPVKTMTTGEGGMVTTNDPAQAARLAALRSHGITRDPTAFYAPALSIAEDGQPNPWAYEMQTLGFNHRLPDILCALGLSQLTKLPRFVARRRSLAARYRELLAPLAPWSASSRPPPAAIRPCTCSSP